MKAKLHFKLIGILITIALIGIIAFQGYWLKGLYDTLSIQMDANIEEAMKMADYKELFYRMEEIKKRSEKPVNRIEASLSSGDDKEDSLNDSLGNMSLEGIDLRNQVDSAVSEVYKVLDGMESMILQSIHNQMDSMIPARVHVYDSLLYEELKAKNIDTRYQLSMVHKTNENHMVYETLRKHHPGMNEDTTAAALDWKDSKYYDYPIKYYPRQGEYTEAGEGVIYHPFTYRLFIKSPARVVLQQMRGILASSLLVVVVVIFTFVYLLRTILRQKTLEELKTDFTNNMTHELKTPISVSYAAVDALLNFGEPVNEKQKKYLTIVHEQLTRLTGLVEQILTLAVEDRDTFRLHPEAVKVNELIGKLIEQHRVKSDKSIDFIIDLPDDLTIAADRTHLYNMMNNLIDNALKYSKSDPTVIKISYKQDADYQLLSISDNGPGISIAHQNRIFDRFYRIPSGNLHDVKGHGLGLYYVKDMMNKHGGSVSIDSTIGKGSTFTLCFKTDK